jgi:hypothetical protein
MRIFLVLCELFMNEDFILLKYYALLERGRGVELRLVGINMGSKRVSSGSSMRTALVIPVMVPLA